MRQRLREMFGSALLFLALLSLYLPTASAQSGPPLLLRFPTVSKTQHGDTRIGAGPAITHGGCNHPDVVARLEVVAKAKRIPLQHEAMSNTSGTDTDVIFWTRGGIASALISLPNRYMHSPVEVVSLKDLDYIPELMAAFAHSLKRGEEFKVKIL